MAGIWSIHRLANADQTPAPQTAKSAIVRALAQSANWGITTMPAAAVLVTAPATATRATPPRRAKPACPPSTHHRASASNACHNA